MRMRFLTICGALLVLPPTYAAEPVQVVEPAKSIPAALDPQKQVAVIDAVVAVVNDDVITRRELDDRLDSVVRQLRRQGTPLPAPEVLEKQMLERMITDMLAAGSCDFAHRAAERLSVAGGVPREAGGGRRGLQEVP